MFSLLAVIYYFGPSVRQNFRLLTPGAVFTIAVWLLLESFFRFYIDHFGRYDQTYGTVGGVAILLLFFYIDAFVLLVGAEINSEIDFARGIPRGTYDFRESAVVPFKEPESSEDEPEDSPANPRLILIYSFSRPRLRAASRMPSCPRMAMPSEKISKLFRNPLTFLNSSCLIVRSWHFGAPAVLGTL